jgi:hypothetical protein
MLLRLARAKISWHGTIAHVHHLVLSATVTMFLPMSLHVALDDWR